MEKRAQVEYSKAWSPAKGGGRVVVVDIAGLQVAPNKRIASALVSSTRVLPAQLPDESENADT